MDGTGAGDHRGVHDGSDIEIGSHPAPRQADQTVRRLGVRTLPIVVGRHCDGLETVVRGGAKEADRDLAAIGYQQGAIDHERQSPGRCEPES
jgi:hypothetical protein